MDIDLNSRCLNSHSFTSHCRSPCRAFLSTKLQPTAVVRVGGCYSQGCRRPDSSARSGSLLQAGANQVC
jgi:hypothetical protein